MTITFDQAIQGNPALNAGNWHATLGGFRRDTATAFTVGANQVHTTPGGIAFPTAGRSVDFEPPPFDVLGLTGQQAAQFIGFPIA